jgi:hypothetical protein
MNILTVGDYLEYMILLRYPVNEDICANLNSFTSERSVSFDPRLGIQNPFSLFVVHVVYTEEC